MDKGVDQNQDGIVSDAEYESFGFGEVYRR
jgi:hypothetical protein